MAALWLSPHLPCIYPVCQAELKGKLNGLAIRVPLLNGSITDCVFEVKRSTTAEEVNALFKVQDGLLVEGWLPAVACRVAADSEEVFLPVRPPSIHSLPWLCAPLMRSHVCVCAGSSRDLPQRHPGV